MNSRPKKSPSFQSHFPSLLQSILAINDSSSSSFLSQLPEIKQLDERLPASLALSSISPPGLPELGPASAGSTFGQPRVLACEETLQVASPWQVSIDAIDFKLKRGVRPSITGVHCRHSCSVMHGLPGPDLHDHALPSDLVYGGGLRFPPCPRPSSHPPSSRLQVQSTAVWRSQEWNVIVFITPPRAAAVQPPTSMYFTPKCFPGSD